MGNGNMVSVCHHIKIQIFCITKHSSLVCTASYAAITVIMCMHSTVQGC